MLSSQIQLRGGRRDWIGKVLNRLVYQYFRYYDCEILIVKKNREGIKFTIFLQSFSSSNLWKEEEELNFLRSVAFSHRRRTRKCFLRRTFCNYLYRIVCNLSKSHLNDSFNFSFLYFFATKYRNNDNITTSCAFPAFLTQTIIVMFIKI